MTTNFYYCEACGNVVTKLTDSGITPYCCGQEMSKLEANESEDTMGEKHVPSYKIDGNKLHIQVGSDMHPHNNEHHIEWIYVETENSRMVKFFRPTDPPEACFKLTNNDKLIKIYAYCNLHGLWICEYCDKCMKSLKDKKE